MVKRGGKGSYRSQHEYKYSIATSLWSCFNFWFFLPFYPAIWYITILYPVNLKFMFPQWWAKQCLGPNNLLRLLIPSFILLLNYGIKSRIRYPNRQWLWPDHVVAQDTWSTTTPQNMFIITFKTSLARPWCGVTTLILWLIKSTYIRLILTCFETNKQYNIQIKCSK